EAQPAVEKGAGTPRTPRRDGGRPVAALVDRVGLDILDGLGLPPEQAGDSIAAARQAGPRAAMACDRTGEGHGLGLALCDEATLGLVVVASPARLEPQFEPRLPAARGHEQVGGQRSRLLADLLDRDREGDRDRQRLLPDRLQCPRHEAGCERDARGLAEIDEARLRAESGIGDPLNGYAGVGRKQRQAVAEVMRRRDDRALAGPYAEALGPVEGGYGAADPGRAVAREDRQPLRATGCEDDALCRDGDHAALGAGFAQFDLMGLDARAGEPECVGAEQNRDRVERRDPLR